ncbi:MAG: hypothetical protein QME66_04115 [Candidatus Eisenbacteria bacterium]|nr:hypothetical protein [Candidatus Eisenbacteria bacterium]
MIDIHTHILPFVDPDGPQSLDGSLVMARQAWNDGVKVAFGTPHIVSDRPRQNGKKWKEARDRLDEALRNEGISLDVRLGGEVYFTEKLESFLEENNVFLDEAHRFFLVEFQLTSFPSGAESILSRAVRKGMVPILAHIERNLAMSKNRVPVCDLVQMGCLTQITGGSLLGYFGDTAKEKAKELLGNGLVHFLASDAHDPVDRPPVLAAALKEASKIIGDTEAGRLVHENPKSLVDGASHLRR